MTALRTMAIRVFPGYRESFDSWIQRYATEVDSTRSALLSHFGVRDSENLSIAMPTATISRIAKITGLDEDVIRGTTLQAYEYRGIKARDAIRDIRGQNVNGQKTHTRVCAQCLEDTGQWQTAWRLRWVFACLQHSALLIDTCPERNHYIASVPMLLGSDRNVWDCTTKIGPSRACGVDLRRAVQEYLPPEHPLLYAQAQILARIESGDDSTAIIDYLRDVDAIARAVAAENNVDRVSRVVDIPAPLLMGYDTDSGRTVMPTLESIIDGALFTYAVRVLDDLTDRGQSSLFDPVVNYARSLDNRSSPERIVQRWGRISDALFEHVKGRLNAAALDVQRLRYYTPIDPQRRPGKQRSTLHARARSTPQLLWDVVVAPFTNPGALRDPELQVAGSVALLLPGADFDAATAEELLHAQEIPAGFTYLQRFDSDFRTDLFSVLCRLADHLDEHPSPIDYDRRRRMNTESLFGVDAWATATQRLRLPTGRVANRRLRHWMWSRFTGSHLHVAPDWLEYQSVQDRPSFKLKPDAGLVRNLDHYAESWLEARGIFNEPATWRPPTTPLQLPTNWTGPSALAP